MASRISSNPYRLDVLGLFLAGLINTFLALFVAGIILGPGLRVNQPELMLRIEWIAEHTSRWQGGWAFWFAVTLSFAWSFYALGRHLRTKLPWSSLAIGVAIIAAAVDLVGVVLNITVVPELSAVLSISSADTLQPVFLAMESLADALINLAAFGLYSFAGLLLLPALFGTQEYPRGLAWLGAAEWGIAAVVTVLLVSNRGLATGPLLISFALYAPWVWGSAYWLWRLKPEKPTDE